MKSEMSEQEFRTNICLLAKHFRTGEPIDQALFKLEYYRPKPKNPVARWFAALKDLMTPRSQIVEHCKVCGKEPLRGRTYCERCRRLVLGEMDRNVKVETLKAAYDKDVDGFRCHYTGFLLDLNDRASPWHLNFDHCFPGRPGKYWLACQIINLMKTELSEEEFKKVVMELAGHFETGAPYDRDIIKFEYWKRPRQ